MNEFVLGIIVDFVAIQLILFLTKLVLVKLPSKSFKPSIIELASSVISNISVIT